jgi:hypothetical protein
MALSDRSNDRPLCKATVSVVANILAYCDFRRPRSTGRGACKTPPGLTKARLRACGQWLHTPLTYPATVRRDLLFCLPVFLGFLISSGANGAAWRLLWALGVVGASLMGKLKSIEELFSGRHCDREVGISDL